MSTPVKENQYINREMIDRFWPLAVLFFCVYIPVSFFISHDYLSGWFQVADLLILAIAMVVYFKTKNATGMSNVLASLGIPVLIPWLISGGPAGVGLWWSLVYAGWIFFITRKRVAFFWVSLYVALCCMVIAVSATGAFKIAYSATELLNLLFAFAFTSALVYFFNESNERYFNLSNMELNERRKAETELQRQAELFNVMPDAVMYGMRTFDQITVTSLNKAARELFDIKPADAIGHSMDDFVKMEVVGLTRDEVREELWGEKGYWRGEIIYTTKRGKKIIALVTFKTIKDGVGSGVSWMGIFTDITVLKKTQQRLEFALDGMIAGLWEWDIVNNTRWWSPKYFELLDYENNEIEPSRETLQQLVHPDDAPMVFDTIGQYLDKTERFEIEHRFKLKSGIYHWFRATGKTRFDANGKPLIMAGSIIDIDEKKRAMDMIKQQARLIQMVPDGIIFASKSRKFADVNAGAEAMFDLKREKVLGKDIDEFISLAFPPGVRFEDEFATLWRNGFWHGEMQVTNRKTGKVVSVLANIKTVENMDGGEPGYMTIYTDLSPLMINKELKVANEYLEQLAFISAHDIKAPIHSIEGLTDILLESVNLNNEQVNILQMQKDVVRQMQQTNKGLNDILQFRKGLLSRDPAGGGSLSLKEIVSNVITGLRTGMESSGAVVQLNLGDVAEVQFPYFYMQSVFHNLIANSIKYRDPKRPLLVTVEAEKTASGGFRFSVADNGTGFDMDLFGAKLFGIFKRFHPHIEGTGIGLHIVKSIVDAFGGEVSVQSETGKGTKFEITLKK